ncbi:MAG: hypothetical protein VX684_07680, partial [Planctomycetota bacterium]|nr:hypothetical protein [Planctomycetota bacterium]
MTHDAKISRTLILTTTLAGGLALAGGCTTPERATDVTTTGDEPATAMTAIRGSESAMPQDEGERRAGRMMEQRMQEFEQRVRADFDRREQQLVQRFNEELNQRTQFLSESFQRGLMEQAQHRDHMFAQLSGRIDEVHHR